MKRNLNFVKSGPRILIAFSILGLLPSFASPTRAATAANSAFASCDHLAVTAAPRQPVDSRIEESGLSVQFQLKIVGCKGKDIPVHVYAIDAANNETFLAEGTAKAIYNETSWDHFTIFVPLSRFSSVAPAAKIRVYVRAPGNPRAFIGSATFRFRENLNPDFVWRWKAWQDEAEKGTERVFQIKVRLHEGRYEERSVKAVVILEDRQGNTLKSPDGTPLVTQGYTLTCSVCRVTESAVWETLTFEVPYSLLARYAPETIVFARPGLQFDNGELIGGNVYVKFLAGGSLDHVYDRFQEDSANLKDAIKSIDRKIEALEQNTP